jgi:DNA-binding XRE family transcriptional regulator
LFPVLSHPVHSYKWPNHLRLQAQLRATGEEAAAALALLRQTVRALDKDEDKEEADEEEQEQEKKEEEAVREVHFVVRGNIEPDSNNDQFRLHEATIEQAMSRQILAPVLGASAPPVIA